MFHVQRALSDRRASMAHVEQVGLRPHPIAAFSVRGNWCPTSSRQHGVLSPTVPRETREQVATR